MSWREARWFGRPWQDLVFAGGEVVFLISFIPLFFDKSSHVPLISGLTAGGMLGIFVLAQVSYRNWVTVPLTSLAAMMWILLGLGVHL